MISSSRNLPSFSSIGAIILSSDSPNTSFITNITAWANFHKPRCFNSLCTTSKATEEQAEKEEEPASKEQAEVVSPLPSRRSQPAQSGETFDGPPSLERSGSEHRRAVTSPLLRFLSPGNGGTEGGVKTIEEGLGEKVGKHPTPMTIQLHPQCLLGIQSILRI